MKDLRNLLICVGLFILVPCLAFSDSNSFAPPSGNTLLLIGQDRNTISKYVKSMGDIPGGTMLYTSPPRLEGLKWATEYGSGPQDGNALLHSYPNSVIQIGLYLVDNIDGVLAGRYDDHLKILAKWIRKANRPVYLRIGYEFDLPANHYDPQQYIQAFRYVVDYMRKVGVKNVAYVWHSQCVENSSQQWMDWYPGDDYVDWFGVSIFSTQQIPTAIKFLKLAREHGKPFMICESTPEGTYSVRGKIDWFKHIFQFIKDQKVEAFCYINSNWDVMPMYKGQHWGDARIEEYPEIKDLWLKEIDQERYLKASSDLYRTLGW